MAVDPVPAPRKAASLLQTPRRYELYTGDVLSGSEMFKCNRQAAVHRGLCNYTIGVAT